MSLSSRMDVRTTGQFAVDVSQFTTIEQYWGVALLYDFRARTGSCDVIDYGVDNTGQVIYGNLKNCNADKKYVFPDDSSIRIEICSHSRVEYTPDLAFATFKVDKLERLAARRHVDAIVMPILDSYYMFDDIGAAYMLDSIEPTCDRDAWGYKPVIRIQRKNWRDNGASIEYMLQSGMLERHCWCPQAHEFISQHYHILYEPRRSLQV